MVIGYVLLHVHAAALVTEAVVVHIHERVYYCPCNRTLAINSLSICHFYLGVC